MEERFSFEHSLEVIMNSIQHLRDGGGVKYMSSEIFQAIGRDQST